MSRRGQVEKLDELPDRPADFHPLAGHAVALPDVDHDSAGPRLRLLGPAIVPGLILDHAALPPGDAPATRRAVDRAFGIWATDTASKRPPGRAGVHLLEEILQTPVELKSPLRSEITEGARATVAMTDHQMRVLRRLQGIRRAQVIGAAGTGKTLLAAEKASQLARQGYDTLLVCFNSPLARLLTGLTEETARERGHLTVSTFHGLCEDLGREAGTLRPKPDPVDQAWFDDALPAALDAAIGKLGARYHALVIDDAILCDSIRRFKGLERPVVVLVELKPDDKRREQLLYVGASRATQHLIVIGTGASGR